MESPDVMAKPNCPVNTPIALKYPNNMVAVSSIPFDKNGELVTMPFESEMAKASSPKRKYNIKLFLSSLIGSKRVPWRARMELKHLNLF